eukprot:CAMPEP_0172894148 /NCGR_PEP_ID=MMETSP1075-20121228/150213_1 /TAXON_ID=2916 /ORGANISM="Ceratium fusus, Strain PA161109" /LENGTH=117 /DNA_ID=CAMNT_0013749121 /DNA_START=489 /DNA_END=839 /DNA_ORIENTATION=+
MAFNQFYKNKTVHWHGSLHSVKKGLSFSWWSQYGAAFVRMDPPQFPARRGIPDVLLLYAEGTPLAADVRALRRGTKIDFEATAVEAGRRGAAHMMILWNLSTQAMDLERDRLNEPTL